MPFKIAVRITTAVVTALLAALWVTVMAGALHPAMAATTY
jgi:hypothetical protein